jgi:uncharacterized protein YaeQ
MALKATISKAELQVSDMDRHYYQGHSLTLAQHPSETEERMMIRLLAFGLNASEHTGLRQGHQHRRRAGPVGARPDRADRYLGRSRAAGRAAHPQGLRAGRGSAGLFFSGRSARDLVAEERRGAAEVLEPARVRDSDESSQGLAAMASRSMKLQCLVQDGQVQVMEDDGATVTIDLVTLK